MTKIPTLVKIDEFKGRQHGGDLDILKQWKELEKTKKEKRKKARKEFDDLLGGY